MTESARVAGLVFVSSSKQHDVWSRQAAASHAYVESIDNAIGVNCFILRDPLASLGPDSTTSFC